MKQILLVDDDKILRDNLQEYLEAMGYQVTGVSEPQTAINLLVTQPPDLIISDVMMPAMNGLDFCRQVRAIPSGQLIPFIFLSGRDELEDRIRGHEMGADDYMTKPFVLRELLVKIEAQLERSRRIHTEIVRMMQQISSPTTVQSAPLGIETTRTPEPLPLTPAEERVFWEVIQGFTNKQISDRLFISPRTVQSHLSNILSKLNLENRAQLVRFAYEQGHQSPHASQS
ncbi:response regulator transcription factor [Spirulina sp. CCNP1310]|uniref:response regulator transcription factor n=1 Tax=Spirulina sp. CCNP1310 TaxID=3110249 RepID=UPI002B204B17|nr:response regulator transcription factor [Spirulina sp. CCNP1310]MEA5420142.1 response regulator transcription factor [Spirulina sp. CCNP1310]